MTMPGTDEKLSFGAEGGFDTAAKRAQLTVDLSVVRRAPEEPWLGLRGTVKGDLGSPEDWKLEVIQDGDTAYIHFPLLAKQLPAGKTWIKGDAKELSGANAGQLSQFGSLAGTDPRDVFGVLKAVSGSIEAVGSDEIRGVETSHYHATIDPAKIAGADPRRAAPEPRRARPGRQAGGLTADPFDVWIDADQQLRKLTVDLDAKQPGTSDSVKASLDLELYDYGKALELELPPADQVADAAAEPLVGKRTLSAASQAPSRAELADPGPPQLPSH